MKALCEHQINTVYRRFRNEWQNERAQQRHPTVYVEMDIFDSI